MLFVRDDIYTVVSLTKLQTILKKNGASTLKHEGIIHCHCHEMREYFSSKSEVWQTMLEKMDVELLSHNKYTLIED